MILEGLRCVTCGFKGISEGFRGVTGSLESVEALSGAFLGCLITNVSCVLLFMGGSN